MTALLTLKQPEALIGGTDCYASRADHSSSSLLHKQLHGGLHLLFYCTMVYSGNEALYALNVEAGLPQCGSVP